MPAEFSLDNHAAVHRLEPLASPYKVERGEGECAI